MSWDIAKIPVVCINLDRRPDRWERLQSQPGFAEFPRAIQRWPAKDAKTLNPETDPNVSITVRRNIAKKRRRAHEDIGGIGAVGCYYSHLSVAQWLLQQSSPVVLVLEDDIKLPAGTFAKIKEHIAKTPQLQDAHKWDVWNLGAWAQDSTPLDDANMKMTAYFLNHAYLLSKPGAEKLVAHAFPILVQYDGYMSILSQIGILKLYGTKKQLVEQWGDEGSETQGSAACPLCALPDDWKGPKEGFSGPGQNYPSANLREGFAGSQLSPAPFSIQTSASTSVLTPLTLILLATTAWATWRMMRATKAR
jgi:GR25 family glycosyltransferase involved in LPS biosynthesis